MMRSNSVLPPEFTARIRYPLGAVIAVGDPEMTPVAWLSVSPWGSAPEKATTAPPFSTGVFLGMRVPTA